jgi:hypothetical protein
VINGVKGGTATVTVKDSVGAAVSIAVTVGPGTALFTTAPSQMTVAVGAAESFNIGGGAGPFSVSSANSTTATVLLNALGSSFTVTGQRSGTTSVVVTDAKGATVAIGVTVGSGQGSVPLFTSAASPVVIGVGTTPVYTIGGGTGPYQVTSSNESVAKASVVGTSVGISGLAAGTASVQVTDAVGARVNVSVTVGSADVVALSSAWEGSPIAVAECLSIGAPLVTTAVGTVTRHLRDGESARIVPVGDHDAFADALVELLLDPGRAAVIGARGREAGDRVFAAEALVTPLEQVYRTVRRRD